MTAQSSWSLRGVDPRARDVARSAAKREGITIGEWLNRQLLDDSGEYLPGTLSSDPEALAGVLNRLSSRIAAAEQRSALAIAGIDQSVLQAISRLDGAEQEHVRLSDRYAAAIGELRETQQALHARIERLERDGRAPQELTMLKSLEEALAKVAAQVYASEAETNAKLEALKADMDAAAERANTRIDVVSRALDTRIADVERDARAGAARLEASQDALGADLRAARDDIGKLETSVADVDERLVAAERGTDAALKSLEETFAALDARVRRGEATIESLLTSGDRQELAAAVEKRFASLSRELADVVATTRAEIAGKLAELAGWRDATGPIEEQLRSITEHVAVSESKQRKALSRISLKVTKLADAVAQHLRDTQAAARAKAVEEHEARKAQSAQAAELAEIQVRLQQAEETSQAALDAVSRRVEALDERLAGSSGLARDDLSRRLRESEDRTRALIDGAMAAGARRAAAAEPAGESPVQRALDALRSRLDAIESSAGGWSAAFGGPPAAGEPVVPHAPYFDPDAPIELTPEAEREIEALEEQYEEAMGVRSADARDPAPAADGVEGLKDAEALGPIALLPRPAADDDDEEDGFALVYGRRAERRRVFVGPDEEAVTPILDERPPGDRAYILGRDVGRAAYEAIEAMRGARDAVKKGRGLLFAAGGLAFLAVGAAGVIALRDPGRSDDPRDSGGDPLDGLFPGSDAPSTRAAEPVVGRASAAQSQRSIAVDLAGVDFARYAQGGDLAGPKGAPPPDARSDLEKAAQAGDPVAQYQVGAAHIERGDVASGVLLVEAAAEAGIAPAQYLLAQVYESGRMKVDVVEAAVWLERAATAGNRDAMHDLAMHYAAGRGVKQDYEMAVRWFREAAELGATDSQYNLAVLFERGLGVKRSIPDAYAWFTVAGQSGDRGAARQADFLASHRSFDRARVDELARHFAPRPLNLAANGVFDSPLDDAPESGAPVTLAQAASGESEVSRLSAAAIAERRGPRDASRLEKMEARGAAL